MATLLQRQSGSCILSAVTKFKSDLVSKACSLEPSSQLCGSYADTQWQQLSTICICFKVSVCPCALLSL